MFWRTVKNLVAHAAILAFCCRVVLGEDLLEELQTPVIEENPAAVVMSDEEGAASEIVLRESGELAGRVRIIFTTGKIEPADAVVSILKDEEVVASTQTDDAGKFELTGLEPGDYVARAEIPEGSKDFNVQLVSFTPEALPGDMYLDATLTPLPDMVTGEIIADGCGGCGTCSDCLATEVVVDEVIPMDQCMPMVDPCMMGGMCGATCGGGCGFSGGGCCGGGGGGGLLGALAGLGGLAAGITALALDDDNPTSPASP